MNEFLQKAPPLRMGIHTRSEHVLVDSPAYLVRHFESANLKDLEGEFVLFHHGLLFTHGRMSQDPIYVYLNEENPKHVPFIIETPSRIVQGMRFRDARHRIRDEWEYRVLAVHTAGWEPLFRFLQVVGGVDYDNKHFFRLLAHRWEVPDVIALNRTVIMPSPCPMTKVVFFGVDGNDHEVSVEPALNPPIDKPKVRVRTPDPATVKLAEALFGGAELPFTVIDPKGQRHHPVPTKV